MRIHKDATIDPSLSSTKAERSELLHLDLARFVAAIGIVLAHSAEFIIPASDRRQVLGQGFFAGLPIFVDLFFVISGFVISYVYVNRMNSLRDYGVFLQRRVGRLIPLHLLLFFFWWLLWGTVAYLQIPMSHNFSLSPSCLATTAFLLISFVDCGGLSINGITWSISAEIAMYVAFPIVVLLLKRPRLLGLAAIVLFCTTLIQLGGTSHWTQESALRAVPAFLFGALLFTIRKELTKLPRASAWLCLVLAMLFIGGILGWPIQFLLPLAYVAPALAVAADSQIVPAWIRRVAPLGQLTYSIYMIHPVMVTLVLNAIADKMLHLRPPAMALMALATYAALLLASWASYRLYESPARRWIDSLNLFGKSQIRNNLSS